MTTYKTAWRGLQTSVELEQLTIYVATKPALMSVWCISYSKLCDKQRVRTATALTSSFQQVPWRLEALEFNKTRQCLVYGDAYKQYLENGGE